jgi:hypothetical protein
MASKDLHNNIKVSQAIAPAAAHSDNTVVTSNIIDTAGYESVEFQFNIGTIADTDATFTVSMEDGDDSGLTDAAAVSSDFILGSTTDASFSQAKQTSTTKVGYVGHKRYVRVKITPANNSSAAYFDALAVLGNPRFAPVA